MKRVFLLIVGLLISFSAVAQQVDLKVVSYNIRFGEVGSMRQIGRFLKGEAPDFVALQECDWNAHRPQTPYQNECCFVNELAAETDMFGLYGKTINFCGGYYGIGLLSKYPILKSERVLLPHQPRTEQRAMLIADVELPQGQVITFVSVHLEFVTVEARREQLVFINKHFKNWEHPLILAGDFNGCPDGEEIKEFEKKGWTSLSNNESTYPVVAPEEKIDYIYYRGREAITIKELKPMTEVKLSDHFPIKAVFSLEFEE